MAAFWPDGKGLLFWDDPLYSASLAADGLPLESVAPGGRPRTLATTLVQRSLLAFVPGGGAVALQEGGDRYEMGGDKHVEVCALASARCTALGRPKGTVGLDPAWVGPDELAFTVAAASGRYQEGRFRFASMAAWDGTHVLYAGPATGGAAHRERAAGRGVVEVEADPSTGTELLVEGGELFVDPVGARRPTQVSGPLLAERAPIGYYGEVDWSATFAWSALAPTGEELGGDDTAAVLPGPGA